ncbi:MAG TPA: DUF711 family protein [Terriglobales bacterium]|nr:DUF711 family protein [Terriglobales bacterium]
MKARFLASESGVLGAHLIVALLLLSSAQAWSSEMPRRPKIRAVTAFIKLDRSQYQKQISDGLTMLRAAKAEFEKGGYEVQTLRVTTQPFPQYTQGLSRQQALDLFAAMDGLSKREGFVLNIGPALLNDADDLAQAELLAQILSITGVFGSVVVASDDGIHWKSAQAAAKVIKYVEGHSERGGHDFNFAALAMVPPYAPFFPGSYHTGEGHQFSIALEGGNFVLDVFAGAGGDLHVAQERLAAQLNEQARAIEGISLNVETTSGWSYVGLDPSPAPSFDSSIGAAIEKLNGAKFGSSGTMTVAALITSAVRAIQIKRVGYAGLMLPPLEDPVLAQRWSEGTYDIDSLLAYSAVCGTGLDTIPLPGDVSEEQLARMIGDVASLAFKWKKPLSARLIPVPGKKAGENSGSYGPPGMPSATLRAVR